MSNKIQEPILAELLHQLADAWQDFGEICEEQADQIYRNLR